MSTQGESNSYETNSRYGIDNTSPPVETCSFIAKESGTTQPSGTDTVKCSDESARNGNRKIVIESNESNGANQETDTEINETFESSIMHNAQSTDPENNEAINIEISQLTDLNSEGLERTTSDSEDCSSPKLGKRKKGERVSQKRKRSRKRKRSSSSSSSGGGSERRRKKKSKGKCRPWVLSDWFSNNDCRSNSTSSSRSSSCSNEQRDFGSSSDASSIDREFNCEPNKTNTQLSEPHNNEGHSRDTEGCSSPKHPKSKDESHSKKRKKSSRKRKRNIRSSGDDRRSKKKSRGKCRPWILSDWFGSLDSSESNVSSSEDFEMSKSQRPQNEHRQY